MSLTADLLKIGERDVVLRYFELCRSFGKWTEANWINGHRSSWPGKSRIFGPNLVY